MADEDKRDEREDEEKDAKSEELGEAGKRALDAERRARRAAENRAKELEAKVKEAEDAEKTELEKLQGQVADLTKRAESAELTAVRFEVAAAKGLTPAQSRRLVGSTKEELEADADEMRAELGLKEEGHEDESTKDEQEELPQDERPLSRPTENLRGGASNEGDEKVDTAKLADEILKSPW